MRHLIGMSEELISANRSSDTGKLLLAGSGKEFVWASVADIHGLPEVLDWLSWGVESDAVRFPDEAGPISWPAVNLEHIFPRTE